jgi:hypothetical protein
MGHRVRRLDGTYGVMIPGQGLPSGGAVGQMIRKASVTDYATEWFTLSYYTQAEVDVMFSNLATGAYVNLHVGTTAPVSPAVGDLWVDTN